MKTSFVTLALFFVFCSLAAAQECKVDIVQTLGSAWTVNGQAYSQWSVAITAGPKDVKSLALSLGGNFDQLWEITKDFRGLYVLPDYVLQAGGIKAGKTHNFGYIIKSANKATIDLEAIDCQGAAASPSAAPASPSSSPAGNPSSAPASPSSSPAAASPSSQPSSGCSVTTTQTARSAAEGGQWKDATYSYQIYDLAVKNAGSKVVTTAQLTFTLASGASFYQFWNLERKDTSDVFVVPNYGGIQLGASQSSGYVVRTPLANGAATAPVIHVDSATCGGSTTQPSSAPSSAPSNAPSSAPASPSPSTIVSTPQPSSAPAGCSAKVTVAARSGSNWQDASGFNQIYDITITNTGSRAISGGQVTFGLGAGVGITQFWELNRKTANVFAIPTTYGPLQVGSSQGAGIVASRSAGAPIPLPTATLDSVTCY